MVLRRRAVTSQTTKNARLASPRSTSRNVFTRGIPPPSERSSCSRADRSHGWSQLVLGPGARRRVVVGDDVTLDRHINTAGRLTPSGVEVGRHGDDVCIATTCAHSRSPTTFSRFYRPRLYDSPPSGLFTAKSTREPTEVMFISETFHGQLLLRRRGLERSVSAELAPCGSLKTRTSNVGVRCY